MSSSDTQWRITHLGGTYPSGHPLAGSVVGILHITDAKRKDYGGTNKVDTDVVSINPGITVYLEDTPELRRSYSSYSGMLRKLESLGLIQVTPSARLIDTLIASAIQFRYNPAIYTDGGTNLITASVEIDNGTGGRVYVYPTTSVRVDITGNTTGGVITINNGTPGSNTIVPVSYGISSFPVTCTGGGAGIVTLGLTDTAVTGLAVVSTATLTYT